MEIRGSYERCWGVVEAYWTKQGVRLCSGASEQEIGEFEVKHGVLFPNDFRQYLAAVNGFDGSTHWVADDDIVEFFGLNEISPVSEYWSPEVESANDYFVFADYMLSCWVYAIRLRVQPGEENTVALVLDSKPVKLASSFTAFVQGYLENSRAMLFPSSEAEQVLSGDVFKATRA